MLGAGLLRIVAMRGTCAGGVLDWPVSNVGSGLVRFMAFRFGSCVSS